MSNVELTKSEVEALDEDEIERAKEEVEEGDRGA